MRGRPFPVTELPEKLRKKLEQRLIRQGFRDYKGLAEWIRKQGHEIPVNSLRRYGMSLARDLKTTRLATPRRRAGAQPLPDGFSVTMEDLMQLAQEKLCSALAEIDQLKQGDMSRLAHAVAHLTQAAISLQRWNDELNQRIEERERANPQAQSKLHGGLSPETSRALRNALLGIAPLNLEQIGWRKAAEDQNQASAPPATAVPDQFESGEESSRIESAAILEKPDGPGDDGAE